MTSWKAFFIYCSQIIKMICFWVRHLWPRQKKLCRRQKRCMALWRAKENILEKLEKVNTVSHPVIQRTTLTNGSQEDVQLGYAQLCIKRNGRNIVDQQQWKEGQQKYWPFAWWCCGVWCWGGKTVNRHQYFCISDWSKHVIHCQWWWFHTEPSSQRIVAIKDEIGFISESAPPIIPVMKSSYSTADFSVNDPGWPRL